jgi:hypothetical protein
MRIYTTGIGLRIGATVLGIGYGVVGAFSIFQSGRAPTPELADRALWLGITFLIASVLAIAVTWLVSDLSNIWCRPPRSTPPPKRR